MPPACPQWTQSPPSLTGWLATVTPGTMMDVSSLSASLGTVAGCKAKKIYYRPGTVPANPCPYDQFHDLTARSWTSPQPEDPPCPTCMITKGSPTFKLYIEIDPQWQGGQLHDATLTVGKTKIHLGLAPLAPGDKVIVAKIPDLTLHPTAKIALDPGADVPIFVSFRIEHNGEQMSVLNPVFLAP